jgi:hypothetical protein
MPAASTRASKTSGAEERLPSSMLNSGLSVAEAQRERRQVYSAYIIYGVNLANAFTHNALDISCSSGSLAHARKMPLPGRTFCVISPALAKPHAARWIARCSTGAPCLRLVNKRCNNWSNTKEQRMLQVLKSQKYSTTRYVSVPATGKKTSDSVKIEEEVWMNIPSQEAKLS